jgi:hypothetical protein
MPSLRLILGFLAAHVVLTLVALLLTRGRDVVPLDVAFYVSAGSLCLAFLSVLSSLNEPKKGIVRSALWGEPMKPFDPETSEHKLAGATRVNLAWVAGAVINMGIFWLALRA